MAFYRDSFRKESFEVRPGHDHQGVQAVWYPAPRIKDQAKSEHKDLWANENLNPKSLLDYKSLGSILREEDGRW